MSLTPFLILGIALVLAVVALFVWRKSVASGEDDSLHVLDGASVQRSNAQVAVAQKLDLIDKWGKITTVVAVVYAVLVGGLYLYQSWVQNSNLGL